MNYVSVGKILNFHGLQGEAKVGFSQNQEDFLKKLKKVFVKQASTESDYLEFTVSSIRFNKKFALIKFKEINSINDLMPLKGALIFVQEEFVRENLKEEEFLIDELTGMDVLDMQENKIGVVTGVCNNGINDFISVQSKTNKISLVPFVKDLVPQIDIKNKKVIINNIEGLIE